MGWCIPELLLGVSMVAWPGLWDVEMVQGRNRSVQGGASLCCWVSGLSLAILGWACLPGNAGAMAADAPVSFVSHF